MIVSLKRLERECGIMSVKRTGAADNGNRPKLMFYAVAAILIGSFLIRLLTPAHEYPMRAEQVMTMLLDLLLTVGLYGVWKRSRGPEPLYWTALSAGIGLFLIRLHSDASWWTGHYSYFLLPR
jgi:hypothetical protein